MSTSWEKEITTITENTGIKYTEDVGAARAMMETSM